MKFKGFVKSFLSTENLDRDQSILQLILKIIQYCVVVEFGSCCRIDILTLPYISRITIFYEVFHLVIVLIDCDSRRR